MKHFRLLFAAILLWAGVASSYANSGYNDHGTRDINGVTYHLYYFWSYYYGQTSRGVAYVEGFDSSYSGSEITILESITDGGTSYKVEWLRYNPAITRRTNTLSSSTVQTIHFQSWPAFNPDASSPTFDCPNLKTIYFEGASPSFYASYESYFKSPGKNNITVWVSDKTPEEITALRTNSAVWCDFAAVNLIPNANVKRNVFLTISNARMYVDQGSTSVPYIADKELQVDLYSNLSFRIDKTYGSGNPYEVMSVKLNGQEFIGEMHDSGTYYWYDLQNITNDVFISVASENTKYEASVICNDGGTCYSSDAVIYGGVIQPGDRQTIRWDKSNADGSNLQIRPKEGYTLDHFYYNSYDNTNRVTRNSDGTYTYNLTGNAEISVVFKSVGENILFADPNVKAICVANWDTNGDGELSKAEAAAVTTVGTVFKENADITSFDEFQYFTGVTSIGEMAFYNCTSLKSIILPPTITSIDRWGLCGCSSLEQINLPESLRTINQNAFNGSGLKTLFIPKNVNYIIYGITGNCQNLVSVVVDSDNGKYDSRNGCNAILYNDDSNENNEEVVLLAGCKTTRIPEGVTKISSSCFYYQKTLTSIEIPSTVTQVGACAFYCCSGLSQVVSKALVPPAIETEGTNHSFYGIGNSCTLTVPYGTRDAYIEAGWTETVFKGGVIEAAPEPGDILKAVVVPADGQFIKVFTGEDNNIGFDNKTFTCEMQKGGTYKIGIGNKPASEDHLFINGVEQTEYVVDENGYLVYTVTNVTEDMLIEAKYAYTEWYVPICTTPGGKTTIYYTSKTDGEEHWVNKEPTEPSIFELYHIEPNTDIRFILKPQEGYRLFLVFCGWEREIGAEEGKEVKPLEDGSYEFTLPAYQITTDKTTPIIIYQKIGEDVPDIPGDLNGDGKVTVADITIMVNIILGRQ